MEVQSVAVFTCGHIIDSLQSYRLLSPLTHANMIINRGLLDGEFSIDPVTESDITVVQRDFPVNLSNYRALMAQAAKLHKPVVMDLDDDLLALPLNHPDRAKLIYAKAQTPILTAMVQATALTVTTPYLAGQLRKYNSNIFVLPNYLDDSLWKFNEPQVEPVNGKIRILFLGTATHLPDLEMLRSAFLALAEKYPDQLEFVFYGANLVFEEDIHAKVTNYPSETFVYADYVKIALAQKANIAIAPLEDIPFNHCKSSIKFFEYSAIGLPGVYSRITPYTAVVEDGVNGFTASTETEWVEALSRLVDDPHLRESMALAAQETVRRDWLLSDHAQLWGETYAEIAELTTPNQAAITAYLPVLEDINLHLDALFEKQAQMMIAKSDENSKLTQQLQQTHQALIEKSDENSKLTQQLQQTHQALIEKSDENSKLTQQLQQTHLALVEKSEEIADLNDQLDNLSLQCTDQTRQIQALEFENRSAMAGWDAAKREVVDYANSTSWRLTRPMRKIVKAIRRRM